MKEQFNKIKSNPIGLLVGAGAGFLVATKGIKTDKMWVKVVSALVGGVAGAMIQSKIKAKSGVPTKAVVEGTKK